MIWELGSRQKNIESEFLGLGIRASGKPGAVHIPKKRPLSSVTDAELAIIEDLLNNRPPKRLWFKTPHELFGESLNPVAFRT